MREKIEHNDVIAFFALLEKWRDETGLNPAAALVACHAATSAIESLLKRAGAKDSDLTALAVDGAGMSEMYVDAVDAVSWLGFKPGEMA